LDLALFSLLIEVLNKVALNDIYNVSCAHIFSAVRRNIWLLLYFDFAQIMKTFYKSAFLLLAFLPLPAFADCTSPAGVAGEMGFDVTGTGFYQYCDGTNWIDMTENTVSGIGGETTFIQSISVGNFHACGLGTDYKSYCWG